MSAAKAKKLWPKAHWIEGAGPYASVSHCPPGTTVMLCKTMVEAQQAKAFIDELGCGGQCNGKHAHVVTAIEDT
jgi:hypothetical protein